ncbi:response regulator [Geomonas sp. RF6]|uniref:sensor histidine kinase n=1 Tax=Geomonas sp. RF6 TaxID=2897342 RepID=UPI001E337D63|nr:response regulator [Geomonas sp. RF6]UFS70924.1 response regulator [Geomonas sp. RF6]
MLEQTIKISLLVVEDDAISRATLVDLISRKFPELEVTSAENGAVGLATYRETPCDIVVTDINMPLINGIDMAKEIRTENPASFVIFLTAFSDSRYLMDAINLGASGYVLKPVDSTLLFAAIREGITRITQGRRIEALTRSLATRSAELETLNQELKATNRELEAFSSMVSHDLRQPLHKINLYCQVLLDLNDTVLDDESKGYLQDITGSVEEIVRLIDALLEFGRISHQPIRKEKVDLGRIASDIANGLSLQQPSRDVLFDIEEGTEAEGDEQLLKLVLHNLLGNAWKFTSKEESARIEFRRLKEDGKQVFFVRDNGVGFELENPDLLFSPFHRYHDKAHYEGHGIGLFTVQRIIQRHGGKVWATGAPREGATFYFALDS